MKTENLSVSDNGENVLLCTCSLCLKDTDKLRIFKNGLVCDDCIEYVQNIIPSCSHRKTVVN